MDRPIVSVHYPKSSGTAFRLALDASFPGAVLYSYDRDPADPASPIWISPERFRRARPASLHPYRVVHGHLPIQAYDLLPTALRIVMLREPVDTMVSVYYHWKRLFMTPETRHALYELVKRERLSLLETAELPLLRRLMSRTYFGDFDMRRMDVIGTYDRRDDFFKAVSEKVGVTLKSDDVANVTPPSDERREATSDPKLMRRLRDLLQDDMRFYEANAGRGRGRLTSKPVFLSLRRLKAAFPVRLARRS